MTEISRPWSGTVTGDAGPYSDANWWEVLSGNGHGGNQANRAIIRGNGSGAVESLFVTETSPASAAVDLQIGYAFNDGTLYTNDAALSLAIASNSSGNPRIDTVILRKDFTAQTIRAAILQGTPAASPVPAGLTQSAALWEIPLAYVDVANGFATITDADITPSGEWFNAPDGSFMDQVDNNSGGTLEHGQVVVIDTSADRSATTTTTLQDETALGIWQEYTLNGAAGRVQTEGIGLVKTTAAVTRGDLLGTSTTAGSLTTVTGGWVVAQALETTSAGGLCLAYIRPRFQKLQRVLITYSQPQNTGGGAATTGADTTYPLNTEEHDVDALVTLAANQITFTKGGTYEGEFWGTWFRVDNGSMFLYNTTSAAEVTDSRLTIDADNTNLVQIVAKRSVIFTVADGDVVELRYRVSTNPGAAALGAAANFGEETYGGIMLEKVA